jgi:4,5-DOPA dioxygenase extradiol
MNRREFSSLIALGTIGFSMQKLTDLATWSRSLTATSTLPVLFVGHGNPMNAIEENEFVSGFRNIAASLPEVQAILVVSAHWLTKGTAVTAMTQPQTIHDFGGFPAELFAQQYPAPGSPELAKEVQELLQPTSVHLNQDWGLDHGTWTVLKHFYPKANLPVIQLSIDYTMSLEAHVALAGQLQALRNKGVLIIGSGNIVHNLGAVDFRHINDVGYAYDWAKEARTYVNQKIEASDLKALCDLKKGPAALQLAVPSTDHYIPMLYALGLKKPGEDLQFFNDKLLAGSLSMTSFQIG